MNPRTSNLKPLGMVGAFLIISVTVVQTSFIPFSYSSVSSLVPPDRDARPAPFADLPTVLGKFEIEALDNLYLLRNPEDLDFIQVIERLPSGGFGRLLRYRGWAEGGKWVDLEFVYQDKENSLTILDYQSGRFFRTTFTGERKDPFSLLPLKDEKAWVGDFIASQPTSLKWILTGRGFKEWNLPEIPWLYSQFDSLSEKEIWSKRLVRGPPAEGMTP